MERQLCLDLVTAEERVASLSKYLQPVKLAPRLVAAACVIVARGDKIQVLGQHAIKLAIAKNEAAQVAKHHKVPISPNTWIAATEELEAKRIIGILRTTRPWTYVLSLEAIGRLQHAVDDVSAGIAALPIFQPEEVDQEPDRSTLGHPSVRVGQGVRDRERQEIQNPCPLPCSVSRDAHSGGVDRVDRPERADRADSRPAPSAIVRGLAGRMERPWDRQSGLTGEDLREAVRTGQLEPLRALYREAKVLEWIGDSEDDLLRFLTAAHHVATVDGLGNRMGALVARMKRECDVNGCRQRSEQWAAGVLRSRHRVDEGRSV
jgi:hypothetical protein